MGWYPCCCADQCQYFYWATTGNGTFEKIEINLNTGAVTSIWTESLSGGFFVDRTMTYDHVNDRAVYMTSHTRIWYTPEAAPGEISIVNENGLVSDCVVAPNDGYVFAIFKLSGEDWKINRWDYPAGTNKTTVYSGADRYYQLAYDDDNSRLFWIEDPAGGGSRRIMKDGSAIITPSYGIDSTDLRWGNDKIIYVIRKLGTGLELRSADHDGTNSTLLDETTSASVRFMPGDMNPDDHKLYYLRRGDTPASINGLYRINTDGTGKEQINALTDFPSTLDLATGGFAVGAPA